MAEKEIRKATNFKLMLYFLYIIRTNMEKKEEIQKLLQEFESLEQEGVEYTIEKYLTLEELKFLIYMRKNKISYDDIKKKIKQRVSS